MSNKKGVSLVTLIADHPVVPSVTHVLGSVTGTQFLSQFFIVVTVTDLTTKFLFKRNFPIAVGKVPIPVGEGGRLMV